MANIHDVARLAAVSPMTVSRVLNRSAPVKEGTRVRVEQAVKRLNYLPNRLAGSIVSKRGAHILALVMPDIVNPFYTSVARGAEDTARANNYTLIICNHDDDSNKEAEYFRSLLSLRVDGFLWIPSGDKARRHLRLLTDHRTPFVLIDRKPKGYSGDYVGGDNINGAIALVQLFISKRHRRIAFIGGPSRISTARDRLTGYKAALEQNSIRFDQNLVYMGENFTGNIAEPALDRFLRASQPPTAVLAANNAIAIGFLRTLRKRGMDVPQDFILACFDRIDAMDLIRPTITMAIQPAYNFGTIAAQLLLERLKNIIVEEHRTILLRPEITIGTSTD
ncbi:MAG TPA: LacI family DNA-binding transcriptional regulator [Chthoniobacterales bacterium]